MLKEAGGAAIVNFEADRTGRACNYAADVCTYLLNPTEVYPIYDERVPVLFHGTGAVTLLRSRPMKKSTGNFVGVWPPGLQYFMPYSLNFVAESFSASKCKLQHSGKGGGKGMEAVLPLVQLTGDFNAFRNARLPAEAPLH